MKKKEVALKLFRHLIEHDWHGYSQISRWGDGAGTCPVVINGKTYQLQQGDRDCSSAIISAFEAAGINCGGSTYTGNMRTCMVATGNFRWHPRGDGYIARPSDVYLNEVCHTALCMSAVPDRLGEFSISETGGIDGQEGDQTGWESHECAYYDYPWDGILECINNEDDKAEEPKKKAPKQIPGEAVNAFGIWYRAHVQNLGWLDPVHDGQAAGTTLHSLRLEALQIDTRKCPGLKIKASAHIQGVGTVDYGYIDHDTVIGIIGKSLRLEALHLEAEGLPDGKKLYIQMHFANDGWGRAVAGGDAGSFGLGKEVQAIKIWIA